VDINGGGVNFEIEAQPRPIGDSADLRAVTGRERCTPASSKGSGWDS
jgi:hypothetical protein